MTGYGLTKKWYAFTEKQTVKILPSHHALYNYLVHLANKMDWPETFGLPTDVTMNRTSIRNWKTYKKTLDDLEEFGFIEVIERPKNQYTSLVIALVENTKASQKQIPKQVISTDQGIADIIKKPNKLLNPNKQKIDEEISENEKEVSIESMEDNRIRTATKKIADFFSISEINMANHYKKIGRFVYEINRLGKIEYLKDQFVAYAELKSIKHHKHAWGNWIGTQEGEWMDGAWNQENWTEKLKEHKASLNPHKEGVQVQLPSYSKLLNKQQQ